LLRDPADEAILGTALAGRAEFLCTLDADRREDGVRIFASISGSQIVTDLELLNLL
jgi:predicted nucleic acid-binding protein